MKAFITLNDFNLLQNRFHVTITTDQHKNTHLDSQNWLENVHSGFHHIANGETAKVFWSRKCSYVTRLKCSFLCKRPCRFVAQSFLGLIEVRKVEIYEVHFVKHFWLPKCCTKMNKTTKIVHILNETSNDMSNRCEQIWTVKHKNVWKALE